MKSGPFIRHLFHWFFYGHVQIALAAAGLGWLSLRLSFGWEPSVNERPVIALLFFATLGVYTLHRYLSFRRAGKRPTTQRYRIVARHPRVSLLIGLLSLLVCGLIGLPLTGRLWRTLIWAVPLTFFYLTPPVKGWRRLRDVPYVKALVVGLAWALITQALPLRALAASEAAPPTYSTQLTVRFLFTFGIAVLFDFRDVTLDRSQRVRTIAGDYPTAARLLVAAAMLISALLVMTTQGYPEEYRTGAGLVYAATVAVAWATHEGRSEAWFAVVVNGLLWGPVVVGLFIAGH